MTAAIALLPYINDFFISAHIVGALAAVWFAVRKRRRVVSFKEGAQLGFESSFYGLLAASGIYDLVWKLFHYQLWKIENADRVIGILGEMVRDTFSISAWIVITFQIVISAIFAGIFGAPAGILGVKIFQRKML